MIYLIQSDFIWTYKMGNVYGSRKTMAMQITYELTIKIWCIDEMVFCFILFE